MQDFGRQGAQTGYLMIETFDITDFRCFQHVKLDRLARVNVVTGANATGKSALLEAVYLAGNATAAAVQNIANWRASIPASLVGFPGGGGLVLMGAAPNQPANLESYFNPLFRSSRVGNDVKVTKRVAFSYTDTNNVTYSLGISYQDAGDQTPVPVMRGIGGQLGIVPIIFDRQRRSPAGGLESARLPVTTLPTGQLQQPAANPFGPSMLIFGANMDYAELDNITWFSQLKERGEEAKLIHWVRKEFPFISDVEVLAPSGTSGLYATLTDGTRRRLTSISSGIYKIVSILLASMHLHDGIIIIDEIENGVFYEKYPAVWRVLYDFAKDTRNQLFISSHSKECLEALPDVVGDATGDFCQLRAERDNGSCIVRYISGVAMTAALRGGNDIRGVTDGFEQYQP